MDLRQLSVLRRKIIHFYKLKSFMSRIIVSINEEGFEYDIHSLVKAFYPEADVKVILPSNEKDDKNVEDLLVSSDEGLPDIFIKKDGDTFFMTLVSEKESVVKKVSVENMDRSQTKNVLKQLIYTMLSEHQKRELPWGTLTGIRPTKIARTLLEDGANEAEIDEYVESIRQELKNKLADNDIVQIIN